MPKAKPASTKEKFLVASTELFRRDGYSGTGLKQVVTQAGAPWGSMYHFFPEGKEQLAEAVVRRAGEHDAAEFALAFSKTKTTAEAISAIFKSEAKRLKNTQYSAGCTVASVATDVVNTSSRVLNACSDMFKLWQQTITNGLINNGLADEQAADLAFFLLAQLEGATLLSRTYQSTAPLVNANKVLLATLPSFTP